MNEQLMTKFEKMGARVKVDATADPRDVIRVDIRRDGRGEYFDLRHRQDVAVAVLDLTPSDRHLLLMAREPRKGNAAEVKSKFLCGHDERSWFVAAIPERARVRNMQDAKDALKPQEVWDAIREHAVPMWRRDQRRTAAFVRQGEWFFIPRPKLQVDAQRVLKNEPIRRGAGKPHMCQFLVRSGGEQVYVSIAYPNGLTLEHYRALPERELSGHRWRPMVRDARVHVKGAIRHPDHATIWLKDWHQVVMNTETKARAMQHMAFLD